MNPDFPRADVAMVVGANDMVNPTSEHAHAVRRRASIDELLAGVKHQ